MAWVRIDDQLMRNRKIRDLLARKGGHGALVLHLSGMTYAAAALSDGAVPERDLPVVAAEALVNTTAVNDLVDVGLWDRTDDGYMIHDYLDYQPSRVEVLEERRKAKERKRLSRQRSSGRHAVTDGVTDGVTPPVTDGVSHRGSHGGSHATPVPSRPQTPTELVVSPTGRDAAEPGDDGLLMAVAKARGARLGRSHPTWLDAVVADLDANRARQLANRGLTPAEIDVELDQRRTDPPAQPDEPERSGRLPEASEVVTHVPDDRVADAHAGAAAAREALRKGAA